MAQLAPLPTDDHGLVIFHEGNLPAADNRPQAALRRALSAWRAATLDAGTDTLAAEIALDQLDSDLAALDKLLGDPTGSERAALFHSLCLTR